MTRVFVSLPMNGIPNEKIEAELFKIETMLLYEHWYEDVEIVSGYTDEELPNSLAYLARSIDILSTCDKAWFAPNWDKYRGCRIERQCCEEYGIEVIYK